MKIEAVRLKEEYKTTGKVLQVIYDEALNHIEIPSVQNFISRCQKEYNETEGQDCMIINGRLFDWKEFESDEVIIEFLSLLNRYVSEDTFNKILGGIIDYEKD